MKQIIITCDSHHIHNPLNHKYWELLQQLPVFCGQILFGIDLWWMIRSLHRFWALTHSNAHLMAQVWIKFAQMNKKFMRHTWQMFTLTDSSRVQSKLCYTDQHQGKVWQAPWSNEKLAFTCMWGVGQGHVQEFWGENVLDTWELLGPQPAYLQN